MTNVHVKITIRPITTHLDPPSPGILDLGRALIRTRVRALASDMPYSNQSFFTALVREVPRAWPFFSGIAVVGCAVVYATAGITEADKKASKFLHRWTLTDAFARVRRR